MLGSTLALMTRSLKVDSRLLRTHLFRLLFALFIFFMLFIAHVTGMAFGAPGLRFFTSISYLNAVFITLAGITYFATAITEEKDEGTIGLLRMAGISPLALLLGKSVVRMVTATLVLAIQFPFMMLSVTLGGITSHQILATYLALFAYMVFCANLGLLGSVYSRSSASAVLLTTILLGLFLFSYPLTLVVQEGLSEVFGRGSSAAQSVEPVVDWCLQSNVFARIATILTTGFEQDPLTLEFYRSYGSAFHLYSNLCGALLLFLISWVSFDFFIRDSRSVRERIADLVFGTARGPRRRATVGRVWNQPLLWKDFFFMAGGWKAQLAKFVLYGFLVGFFALIIFEPWDRPFEFQDLWRWQDLGGVTMPVMLILTAIEMAIYAARIFSIEMQDKTFATVAMTPLSLPRIAYTKAAGHLPALLPAAAWFLFGAACAAEEFLEAAWEFLIMPGFWLIPLVYVLFLHVTAYTSLFINWAAALPLSIVLCVITFYILGSCCAMPLMLVFSLGAGSGSEEWLLRLAFLPYVLLVLGGIFGLQVMIRKRLEILTEQ